MRQLAVNIHIPEADLGKAGWYGPDTVNGADVPDELVEFVTAPGVWADEPNGDALAELVNRLRQHGAPDELIGALSGEWAGMTDGEDVAVADVARLSDEQLDEMIAGWFEQQRAAQDRQGADDPAPEPDGPQDDPPGGNDTPAGYPEDGTVPDVLGWVSGVAPGQPPSDGWRDRAHYALEQEAARGDHARKGVTDALTTALDQQG